MSNQLVISSGAKVRDLNGVLTGTSGIVSSVPLGAANGVATLDSGGKVPVSQLPSSVVTYLGTWNAATNTPTLVNGTGDAGDMYICNVAGTVNFGAGPVTFAVGDWVLYGSGTWQKSNGQNGTVTSVAVTESGDALTITGSPITTAGTINIGFAGTSGQYVNGAGGLTTFPSLTGFVPYTGATSNVDLGTYGLKAGLITTEGGYNFKILASGTPFENGYSVLSSVAGNVSITQAISAGNLKAFTFDFSAWATNTSYTYNLPDVSGTLALTSDIPSLTGYVPYTGATTDVNLGARNLSSYGINVNGDGTNGGALNLKMYNSLTLGGVGYLSIYAQTDNYFALAWNFIGGVKQAIFSNASIPINTTRYYNLPNADGTIALTSDIPSLTGYVPYTGATANVNLGTFDLTADVITGATGSFASSGGSNTFAINHSSGSGIALNITKGGNGEGLYINKTSGSGNAATIIGTLNATTLVKSGGTASQFLMADGSVNTSVLASGAYLPLAGGTLTGALSGTSATFSGNGLFGGSTNAGNAGTFTLSVGVPGTTAGGLQLWAATNQSSFLQFGDGTSAADNYRGYVSYNHATDTLSLGTASADKVTIASTGAATFSSSVTISGGNDLIFRDASTYISSPATDTLRIITANAERMRITSGGDVLVGTTSPIFSGKISISAALYTASVGLSIQNTQTTYGAATSFIAFVNSGGAAAGNIYQSAGTTVNYNTSSDARLKQDIGIATDTSVIDNTIIHDFTWKADSRIDRGVFAQEAYEVKPSAVGVGKDDLTNDGQLVHPWSVDYSKYVPDLIVHAQQLKKQVQEQQAQIEELKAMIAAK